MARNWMVNPIIHCTNHLNGAHSECHIFTGILKQRKRIDGYIGIIEICSLVRYHNILVEEMLRRNWNHKSPLTEDMLFLDHIPKDYYYHKIDRKKSLEELLDRCPKCKANYDYWNSIIDNVHYSDFFFV